MKKQACVWAASCLGLLMTACGGINIGKTNVLTVNSTNPSSGVSIAVSPADSNNAAAGSTSFTRTYMPGTVVTLIAPPTSGSNAFSSWTGCASSSTVTCTVTLDADTTVTAAYGASALLIPTVTVTPASTSIAASQSLSVTIAVSGAGTNPTPTGSVALASGTYTSAVTTLASDSATIAVPPNSLVTGTDTLTATYTPDAASSATYASATGTSKVIVSGSGGTTPSFTLAPSSPTISLAQGANTTDTISVTDLNGFSGNVTFTASGLPSGVTASFSPNSTTGSSVLTLTSSASVLSATSAVTITGTSGSISASVIIALTLTGGTSANTTVSVNQNTTGAAVTDQILGMNMAVWYDIVNNETAIKNAFQTAGIKAVRWPGGSDSDLYHWSTNTLCGGGTPDTNDVFANFVSDLATPDVLDVALTANYGTNTSCNGGGEPSEAAAWAAAAVAHGITVSHMTVGNEVYGSWEEDLHSKPNDPTTYAAAVIGTSGYYQAIKAASPKTLVGVVVDADNTAGGWDNTVLANAKGSYDFVEFHYYPETPGQENDTTLINQDAQQLTANINTVKSELSKWGTPDTPIYVGEIGGPYTTPGKQSMSITQALYAGQVLGEMMNDGVSRLTWWIGFGGCADSNYGANFSGSLYGWQSFGGYMVFSDGLPDGYECTAETLAAGTLLPTARAFQLFSSVAVNGESVLPTGVTGDTTDVVAYAATHSGGTALVLFNRNETTSEPVSVTLSGQATASTITVETYDKAIYDLSGSPTGTIPDPAGTNTWAPPTTTTISSPTPPLSLTLPPWSMNVVIIQ